MDLGSVLVRALACALRTTRCPLITLVIVAACAVAAPVPGVNAKVTVDLATALTKFSPPLDILFVLGLGFVNVAGIPDEELERFFCLDPSLQLPSTFQLGVKLGSEEKGKVGEP